MRLTRPTAPHITVTTGDGFCGVHEDAGEARAAAMDLARSAGRAEVRRWGHPEATASGADATPSFLLGTAVAVGVGAARVVRWREPRADVEAAVRLAVTLDLGDLCRVRAAVDARMRALLEAAPDGSAVSATLRSGRAA